jgi:hypothetical protein|tara:strand:+ start:1248 stop:2381 length:1134 start_codon:yes stop_codon:yes gene_type:complete
MLKIKPFYLNPIMYNRFSAILILSLMGQFCLAQVSIKDLVFESLTYDFGTVFSDQTGLTASYSFTNGSSNPLYISGVDASCGCTNARTTKDTVFPGESAKILAEFNAKGFYGPTNKHVYLRGNFTDGFQVELEFDADVKSEHSTDVDQQYYKGQYGYLVLEKNLFDWSNVLNNAKFTDTLRLLNDGYHDITIQKLAKKSPFLKIRNLPLTLSPNTRGYLLIDVDLTKMDTVGPLYGSIKLITTDLFVPFKDINYSLNVVIDYSKMSKRKVSKAPRIFMNTATVEMGEMFSGAIRSKKVIISNTGKSDLKLQRIESDCTCTLVDPSKRILKPGEELEVTVKYDALHKEGSQVKRVKIYSNDPINPLTTIFVYATVKGR